MTTRSSRRSSGRDTFNPAMIHLLDADRLRKELENRGLDTSGNKSVLADRLQDAVDQGRSSRHSYSPPPVVEKPQGKRGAKRTSKAAEIKDTGQAEASPPVAATKRKRLVTPASEPVEVIEESFSIQLSDDAGSSSAIQVGGEEIVENGSLNTETKAIEVSVVTAAAKSPAKKAPKKASPVNRVQKRKGAELQETAESKDASVHLNISDDKPLGFKTKKTEKKAPEIKKDSMIKAHIEAEFNKKKTEKQGEKTADKSESDKANVAKVLVKEAEDISSKRYVKVDTGEVNERSIQKEDAKKGLKLKLKLEHDKEPHPGPSNERKEIRKPIEANSRKSSDGSLDTSSTSSENLKKKLTKQGSIEKTRETSLPGEKEKAPSVDKEKKNEVEKKKEVAIKKKVPLRMQAVDVFDTIFDKQTELLSSKFKSEEEKAAERQKLELAKRRQSSAQLSLSTPSPAPMEKRRHTVEFNLSPQVFPNRNRVPPPPPPPPPFAGRVDLPFENHRSPPPQRRATPPPPPPVPKRKGVSFDERPMSVILPAPPPPPVLLPPLPPPPPPPLPPQLSPRFLPGDVGASGTKHEVTPSSFSGSTPESPLLPASSGLESGAVTLALHPSYSSPAVFRATTPNLAHSPSTASTSRSPLEPCSASAPSTSGLAFEESGDSYSQVESRSQIPLQQIAKALCSVFAHIGGKSQSVEADIETEKTEEKDDCAGKAQEAPQDEVAEVVQFEREVSIGKDGEQSDDSSGVHLIEIEMVLNDIIDQVASGIVVEQSNAVVAVEEITAADNARTSEEVVEQMDVENDAAKSDATKEPELVASVSEEKSPVETADKEEQAEKKPDICEALLRDPRLLLQKASDVLKNLHSQSTAASAPEEPQRQYEQISPDPDYEAEDEEKPLPEFHGEPVPDSDDDIVIEGIKRKSNARRSTIQEEEPVPGDEHIEIDFYNADLHIKASDSNSSLIDPDNGDGFALMWGGARSTYGIRVPEDISGFPKIAFQAKITEFLPIKHIPFEELDPHDIRIGWSLGTTGNILGESPHSLAYSSLARKAVNSVFTDYGEPFHIDDVVTTILDLERSEVTYYKNEEPLGIAFSDLRFLADDVVFPHICTKNCKVEVNFGDGKPESWLTLDQLKIEESSESRPKFLSSLDRQFLSRGPVPPLSKSDCTVLMMVGLPGVGKSTWVRQYLRDHPHEQWTLLSTDTILSAMKVNGIARSRVHQGRWDMIMGLTAKAMSRSLHLACRRRRNYIIDQTNVSKEARRKKLSQFKDFQRKCVVIIPTEEEMISRQARQVRVDGASATPVEAMLELKASFSIPNIENEPIEGVYFVEPPLERIGEAIELVHRFNEEAKPWCQKKRGRRGDGRSNGGGGDYSRSGDRNNYSQKNTSRLSSDGNPPVVNCDSLGETPQGSAQPSPVVSSRLNQGYCGFGGSVPPSLLPPMDPTVPPPNTWAEHKNSFT